MAEPVKEDFGSEPVKEDFSYLPLPDRFAHKNWKVRKEGYEAAAKEFGNTPDESHPVFKPFVQDPGLFKGAVADSNVAAQQEGINALCAFLKYGGTQACTKTRNSAVSPIVEKGLSSTRAATKQSSLEAIMLYVELDKADPIIEEILPHLAHKQPKIVAAALSAITAMYHAYGVKVIDPKPVLKALPKVFSHADKNVRAEATNLVVEMYRWLREAMKPLFWNDLKPVQQQDLEKLFEPIKEEPRPKRERLLRSQQANGGLEDGMEGEDAEDEPQEVEEIDLTEPVDIFSKVPKDLHENLASKKWSDRKEALDALFAVANVPRIKEGPYDEIIAALAKCMKDTNIAVVTVAANCIDVLAKGQRKSFAKYRSRIMTPMLERLKEKKQLVADALGQALDSVFTSTSLTDCLEEILEFLKHKNPQVKLETLKFLIRCLKHTREVPSDPEVKSIADTATKLLTESTEVTRAGGAEILGTLMKIMGERAMNPYLNGVDDIRKIKIKEYFEAAKVKAKNKPKPVAPPPKAAAAAAAAPPKKVFGQKAVAKAAANVKKPAPRASTPQAEEPASATLQPKQTTGRSIPSKLSGPSKSGLAPPSGGLKLQKRLAGPSNLSSPKRHVPSPNHDDGGTPAPKPTLSHRGLAGRPLGKPITTPSSEPSFPTPRASSISPAERAELEALRSENDRLQRTISELHHEKSKLLSQIHELQHHNAQLIEDHTRDVLSIKAKETQLVRARSDAQAAEQALATQLRENERSRRELGRAARGAADLTPQQQQRPADGDADLADGIYRDNHGMNGAARGGPPTGGGLANFDPGLQRARSYARSPSEEKENGGLEAGKANAAKQGLGRPQ
ncbi:Armadillo-type fold [Lasallia pustulata]|uniref:Armadillo-type fold n=1 Tax=Lasallia pustulata TaxID=136370 RepID=A0A1W5D8A9_9LECA|nr:Armadillo-type fold [Lasallia pustulata]